MKSTKRRTPLPPAKKQTTQAIPWPWAALLVGLVVVIYWPTLSNGFVSDDSWFVMGTARLKSFSGLWQIWFNPGKIPQYNPLAQSVIWLEAQFCALNPRPYHATNIAMHAVVVLLLWRVLARLNVPGAWLAAAFFAVHPVQVETVAWASEVKNLLSAIFALASLLAYWRFSPPEEAPETVKVSSAERGPRLYYALSLAFYIAAVLSKTATVTVPAVLLVIFWWKRGRVEMREVARLVPFFASGIAFACITIWLEKSVVGAFGPEWDFSLLDRVLIAGRAVWFYAGELVWPYPLSITYPRSQIDSSVWWQYLFPGAALALLAALWLLRARIGRGPLAAVLIFGGVLFPTLGFIDVYWFLYSFVADHFQYHACMALVALAAAIAVHVAGSFSPAGYRVAAVAAGGLLLLLSVMSHQKTYAYKDNESIIRDNVAMNPGAWAGHNNLGDWTRDHNQHEQALAEYREALRLFPQRAPLHNNIGVELVALGQADDAAVEFQAALAGVSDDDQRYIAHSNLAQIMKARQRVDEMELHAAAAMEAAVRVAPDNAQVREDAGATFLALGKLNEAEENLRKAIELNPQAAGAHSLLGDALARRGDRDAAIGEYQAALAIDPNHAEATANLRKLLGPTKPPGEAVDANRPKK